MIPRPASCPVAAGFASAHGASVRVLENLGSLGCLPEKPSRLTRCDVHDAAFRRSETAVAGLAGAWRMVRQAEDFRPVTSPSNRRRAVEFVNLRDDWGVRCHAPMRDR
jgi:hypothetical protein